MENLLVFVVVALMSLGLISFGELIVRSLKSSDKSIDYTPVVGAVTEGLNGAESSDISHLFSAIGSHIAHFLAHFLHH